MSKEGITSLDFRVWILDWPSQMNFSFCRKIDFRLMVVIFAISLSACQPTNVREEKALRRQLANELHHHAYQSAVPLARQLIQRQPKDNSAWKRLVQAQIGLHDFDGAKQSVTDWGKAGQPSPHCPGQRRSGRRVARLAKSRGQSTEEPSCPRENRRSRAKPATLERSDRDVECIVTTSRWRVDANQSRRLPSSIAPLG